MFLECHHFQFYLPFFISRSVRVASYFNCTFIAKFLFRLLGLTEPMALILDNNNNDADYNAENENRSCRGR